MACNSTCKYFHYVNSMTISSGKLVLAFSDNPTGLSSTDRFCFRFNPNMSFPSGYASLPVYATINGTQIPVWDKYGNVMTGSELIAASNNAYACPRYVYTGYIGQVVTVSGETQTTTIHLIVSDIPKNTCNCV